MSEFFPLNSRNSASYENIDLLLRQHDKTNDRVLRVAIGIGIFGALFAAAGTITGLVVTWNGSYDVVVRAVCIPAYIGSGIEASSLIWAPPFFLYRYIERKSLEAQRSTEVALNELNSDKSIR